MGAGVEEPIGFIDDEELSLAIDHARNQLEDETAILNAPLSEGDGEEARHLAECSRARNRISDLLSRI